MIRVKNARAIISKHNPQQSHRKVGSLAVVRRILKRINEGRSVVIIARLQSISLEKLCYLEKNIRSRDST